MKRFVIATVVLAAAGAALARAAPVGEAPTARTICDIDALPWDATAVRLEGTKVGDEHLRRLARLRHLRSLTVEGDARITDAGADHLAAITSLRTLDLDFL